MAILHDDLQKYPEKVIAELFKRLDVPMEHLSSSMMAFKVSVLVQIGLFKNRQYSTFEDY